MGGTWDIDSDSLSFGSLFFMGDVSLRTGPPTLPLEWFPFQPLVTAVLITTKGAELPGSGRIGVIGASVFPPHLRPFRINFTLPSRPSSALRHWDVVEYSEVADSVHARRSTLLLWWPLLQNWACPYVSLCLSTWDWWLGLLHRSPGMGEGGDWWSWSMGVIAEGIPRGCPGESSNPRVLGIPTISFQ